MQPSCVQVYTGNGKGKTTAAVGLAARAAGSGLSVRFVQFMKGRATGEIESLKKLGVAFVRASDNKKFFFQMNSEEKQQIRQDVVELLADIEKWLDVDDILIMDEAMSAMACGLLELKELLHIINDRGKTEIVLTGRDAPQAILELADLVTEMKDIKHYMDNGIAARRGIEY